MKAHGWMARKNPLIFVGLGGVSLKESLRAQIWQRTFNIIGVVVAILMLLQWELELLNQMPDHRRLMINIVVLAFFIIQLLTMLCLVKDKKRFLFENWLLSLIIFFGFFVLFQHPVQFIILLKSLRPFLAVIVLFPSIRLLIHFFTDGQLTTSLLAAGIIVVVFGLLVGGVDPNINSPWDGIWWAVATVSTVGYGDVVPTSALGRLLGSGLVVMGLGIFAVITANFLALILRREVKGMAEEEKEVKAIFRGLVRMMDSQKELKNMLGELGDRIERLEKKATNGDKKDPPK